VTPAKEAQREFDRLYDAALSSYLQRRDEEALSVAYDLGRRALADGFGVLDMASVHRAALAHLLPRPSGEQLARVEAAEDFFRELLSPFEMMFRGYAEANAELLRVNDALLHEREAVQAANQELEAFSSAVSHDLRAPLRAIAGFSAILQEQETGPLNVEQNECVAEIREGARRMNGLIEDLLELSKVARADVVRARTDMTAVARDVLEKLQHADPRREVELLVQEALVVDADPGLLRVVLANLLGNAWKFTSKRQAARIELGARREESKEVVYFVRDDGAGFDMAYVKKLFSAFERLHLASEFEGTGIGLATVQRVIRRHGGRIWAEGQPDHGAVFYFTLGEQQAA
jgi:light-regulated signal transduction histidine kinase (bacteriophytochrome)